VQQKGRQKVRLDVYNESNNAQGLLDAVLDFTFIQVAPACHPYTALPAPLLLVHDRTNIT
jgi:hypothetical protein